MKRLVEFPLETGGSIQIEVEVPATRGGFEQAGVADAAVRQATKSFGEALNNIKPAAELILAHLSTLSQRPHEIEVEFGLKLTAQAGAIIACGTTEANFNVTLKWSQKQE